MSTIAVNAATFAAITILASFFLSRTYRVLVLGTLDRYGAINAFSHLMLSFSIRFSLLFGLFWAIERFRS